MTFGIAACGVVSSGAFDNHELRNVGPKTKLKNTTTIQKVIDVSKFLFV